MTECPTLQNAHTNHFDEDDAITFLFDKHAVVLNYVRDAGHTEASRI